MYIYICMYIYIMPELSKDDLLSNLYYDLDKGYGSAQSLYKQAKEENTYSSLEYVKRLGQTTT